MTTKHLACTALVTVIICTLGIAPSVPLPFTPIPIALQNIGILLAGIILGRKLGITSAIVFLLLVTTGPSMLSGSRGGIGVFVGPPAGFLFLYPAVACFIGIIRDAYLCKINFLMVFIVALAIGVLGLGTLGTIIMGFIIHILIPETFILSFILMPGDTTKVIIASLVGAVILNHSCFKTLIQ